MRVDLQAERVFTSRDQERFAEFSGDRNPVHVCPAVARRTQAGECVVHGVHAMLWALEEMTGAGLSPARIVSVKVDFGHFLRLDAPVVLEVRTDRHDRVIADLAQDGRRAAGIDLVLDPERLAAPMSASVSARAGARPRATPREPSLDDIRRAQGAMRPARGAVRLAAEMFPRTVAALGPERAVSIGLLSALVGMVAPGLHSIFSAIRIEFDAEARDWLRYQTAMFDDRFRFVTLRVSGVGFVGSVGAFARFPPVAPPTLADLERKVAPGEFAGRSALIIGGSRGLGACAAMLLAAGGAEVTLTYLKGAAEAEALRTAIARARGADACRIMRYDAAAEPAEQLAEGRWTHAYYFATNRIADAGDAIFDPARFQRFLEVYVDGFARLARMLVARSGGAPLSLFYPSSVFVDARPRGMTEYAMAKAAGEVLCADLTRGHRNLRIACPRLPRLLTDQTATVPPVPVGNPVETLLPLLRAEIAQDAPALARA